ncbi:MAG TPA: MBL fold metallo-hydrolase [Ilumatobacteraceae bacterium]|nr:MBL fold metallo-hydrolase [Ilumatobacteraceae bacterium]
MQVHMCGVRGSTPSPGEQFQQFGGNTSCVAIGHDPDQRPSLILDGGTGLRSLSKLLAGEAFVGTVILGHLHWDHIMGLPFFPAGDRPDSRVNLLLPEQGTDPRQLLMRAMSPPMFPITPDELRGDWTFDSYDEGTFDAEGFTVTAREIPHKGGRTMGLRVSDGRSSIAYMSDHSPHDLGPGDDGLGWLHPAAMELTEGVDMLIHDAQYTAHELPARSTWGHAAAEYSITLGRACGVKRVLLFHHDPSRTDDQVAAMCDKLQEEGGPVVEAAMEGTRFKL